MNKLPKTLILKGYDQRILDRLIVERERKKQEEKLIYQTWLNHLLKS